MTLASQMAADAVTLLQNTDEHATERSVKDHNGEKSTIAVIVDNYTVDVETWAGGTKKVYRALVGLPSSYAVTHEWTFDVDDDGNYWAVDINTGGMQNDKAGWLWVPVTRAVIVEAASENYRRR